MRKLNAVLTTCILALFLAHGVMGAFQLLGIGDNALKTLAWAGTGLVFLHAIIGIKLTVDTLRVQKKTGVSYPRENRLFWARRISGFAVMLLLGFHFTAFGTSSSGVLRLRPFGGFALAVHLLLALALALHILSNVKPVLIAFGIRSLKPRAGDILFVLSVLLFFFAAAFVVYYLRWNVW